LIDLSPQRLLFVPLTIHQVWITQPAQESGVCLVAVLHAEQVVVRQALVLRALSPELLQGPNERPNPRVDKWIRDVAVELKLRHRRQTTRRTRVSRHKYQLPVLGARFAPREVIHGLHRLPVLISAEQREIQIVPRISEVIRISAKRRNRQLGSEHKPD